MIHSSNINNLDIFKTEKAAIEFEQNPYEYYEGLEDNSVNTDRFMAADLNFIDGVAKHVLDNGYKIIVYQNITDEKILYNIDVDKNGKAVCTIYDADYDALDKITYRIKWLEEADECFHIYYVVEDYMQADCFYKYDQRIAVTSKTVEDEAYSVYKRASSPDRLIGEITIQRDTLKNYFIEDVHGVY